MHKAESEILVFISPFHYVSHRITLQRKKRKKEFTLATILLHIKNTVFMNCKMYNLSLKKVLFFLFLFHCCLHEITSNYITKKYSYHTCVLQLRPESPGQHELHK